MGNKELGKLIYSKIFFFYRTKKGNEKLFDSFKTIENGITGKCSGKLELKKAKEPVHYDSLFEKKILEDLDKCDFVKKIKTQSYKIEYKSKTARNIKKYIVDIQILLNDNSIVLIEVKPFKEMVNSTNMRKYKVLRKHSQENGFAFAVIDKDYYSFEDMKKERVESNIVQEFIEHVKNKKTVSFTECNEFKKKYKITDRQICNIIYKNKRKLIYQQHVIRYKKSYTHNPTNLDVE